ncbi:MAG: sugar phosphate isomerase/epimerase family protein [Paraclostridium sp.]
MKIGIPALTFQLEEAINICKASKYINHIEIGIDNLEECEIVNKYLNEISENNISIGIHLPMELNTCENIIYIRKCWVEFANKLYINLNGFDIKYFNMHLGYAISNRYNRVRKKYLNNSIEFIKELSKSVDCELFIENVYYKQGDIINIGTEVEEFKYILDNTPKNNMKICYDTGHNLITHGNYLDELKDKIGLIHLSDNNGEKDEHLGIGKGKLKLSEIKEILELKSHIIILEMNYSELDYSLKLLEEFI